MTSKKTSIKGKIASYQNDAFSALHKALQNQEEWAIKFVLETAHSLEAKNEDLLMHREELESS